MVPRGKGGSLKNIIFATALLVFGYVAAGPYITIHQIKSGVEQKDSEALSEYVDFQILRGNLKDQFNAAVMQKATAEMKNNPFAALAMGFVAKLAEGMVDSFVTPSGLASLMEGKKPLSEEKPQPYSANGERKQALFENSRYSYDSPNKFSIWVKSDNEREFRFVLTRYGFSWKLTNIIIPTDG
jgi:hypothetical protein